MCMYPRMTTLETKQIELDGKISTMLDKTNENSQALANITSIISKVLGRLKDHTSIPIEPKFRYQEQRPSPHVMVPTKETNYVMHDNSYWLDTFAVGSGLESAHSLSRGKIIVGGAAGFRLD